jgi:diacylglycerol kinase family enzyme
MASDSDNSRPPQSPHAVTLVLNPNARKLRLEKLDVDHFKQLLSESPDSEIHLTPDLNSLDELMSNWQHGERTVCFYGGDGSISQGLTALIRHHGENTPLPPVLPVRAGTINVLCNATSKRESAERTLERFVSAETHRLREVATIKIQVEGREPQYGFVFAWGVGFRVLKDYYGRARTPNALSAATAVTHAFLNAIKPFNEDYPMFRRDRIQLSVNGTPPVDEPLHTLTVGTIERTSLGIRPFPPGEIAPGGFHYSANGMSLYKVAAYVPVLLFGLGDQSELNFGPQLICGRQAKRIECLLTDGFTLDGEIFDLPSPTRVTISAGPTARVWTRQ